MKKLKLFLGLLALGVSALYASPTVINPYVNLQSSNNILYGDGSNITGIVAYSTGTIDPACRISTGIINADLQSTKSTTSSQLTAISGATSTIVSNMLATANTWTATQVMPNLNLTYGITASTGVFSTIGSLSTNNFNIVTPSSSGVTNANTGDINITGGNSTTSSAPNLMNTSSIIMKAGNMNWTGITNSGGSYLKLGGGWYNGFSQGSGSVDLHAGDGYNDFTISAASVTIRGGDTTNGGSGTNQSVLIRGGNNSSNSDPYHDAGSVSIGGGNATGSSTGGTGGNVSIYGGTSVSDTGGTATIYGGNSTNSTGGNVQLYGGTGTGSTRGTVAVINNSSFTATYAIITNPKVTNLIFNDGTTQTTAATGVGQFMVSPSTGILAGVMANTVQVSSLSANTVGVTQIQATGVAGASTYLCGNGSWATPAGSGSSGYWVSVATEHLNMGAYRIYGTSSIVITGDVTATNFRGSAANLTSVTAGAIATGSYLNDIRVSSAIYATSAGSAPQFKVSPSSGIINGTLNDGVKVATGSITASGTASATTYLRGDGSWSTPSGSGDAVLAGTQTWTGGNTFNNGITVGGSPSIVGTSINVSTIAFAYFSDGVQTGAFNTSITGNYLNNVKVSTAIFATNATNATNATGIATGNYLNDIKVSSSIYAGVVPASGISAGIVGSGVQVSSMAAKSVGITQINATGTPAAGVYLQGDGTWATPAGTGSSGYWVATATENLNMGNYRIYGSSSIAITGDVTAANFRGSGQYLNNVSSLAANMQLYSNSKKIVDTYDWSVNISTPFALIGSTVCISAFHSFAITYTTVTAICDTGTSVVYHLDWQTLPLTAGTALVAANLTATATAFTGGSAFGTAGKTADNAVFAKIIAVTGDVKNLIIKGRYTKD